MELELNKEELHREENQLREQVASLSVNQKRQYYAQELQQIKDPDTYTALSSSFLFRKMAARIDQFSLCLCGFVFLSFRNIHRVWYSTNRTHFHY